MKDRRRILCLVPLLVGGCASAGSDVTSSPGDWTPYADRTVTLRGSAGNSGRGPIVRFADGGYVPLRLYAPWGIDAVGKPVTVVGRVVPGTGFRAEKYVIEVESINFPPPEDRPARATGASGAYNVPGQTEAAPGGK